MRFIKLAILSAAAALFAFGPAASHKAQAQVSFGINIGPSPVCPYGYYGYSPYRCAPYGYYGPEWFYNGGFIGAGPWYHGRPGFYGRVNHRYDGRYGYRGSYPGAGERWHAYGRNEFHGTRSMDPHGNMRGRR